MNNTLKSILNIDNNNNFLKYIVKRIKNKNYRGLHISQHNRYDLDYVETIISTIYRLSKENYFEIPRGDYSEREGAAKKYNPNDYPIFKQIVRKVKELEGRGTYNSIKKNFFVDFHRMGIIKRFDKDYNETNSHGRQVVFYGKLTDKAVKLIQSKSRFEKHRLFTDFLDNLFQEHLSDLADLIYNSDYKETQLSVYEFMFILSDLQLSNDQKIKLLNSYNGLKQYQKENLIKLLQEYANPDNFTGDKTEKRDFHNWINESQQLLSLMKQTSYFQVDSDNKYFSLNIGSLGIYTEQVIKRSQSIKSEYFTLHNIKKQNDFELHHIIPISRARNKKEVEELDNVNNLIYLHKEKHREITNNKNKNVYLCINQIISEFYDFETNSIKAKNESESLYSKDIKLLKRLVKHNRQLLKKIYEFEKEIECTE